MSGSRRTAALYFAGADVAPHDAGWIEGAFLSGAAAAVWALGRIGRSPVVRW